MPLPKAGGGKADVQLSAMSGKSEIGKEKRCCERVSRKVRVGVIGVREAILRSIEGVCVRKSGLRAGNIGRRVATAIV